MSTESTEPVEPTESADSVATEEEAPAKKSWLKFVIVGVLAVVLIGGGIYLVTKMGGAGSASVGDCASAVDKGENKWDVNVLDCGNDNAAFKVAKVLPSDTEQCPEEGLYVPVPADSKQLCLMPNFAEGQCYTPSDDGSTFKKGGCKGEAVIKVTKRIEGNPDPVECPEGSSDLRFTEPAVIFCLGVGENP